MQLFECLPVYYDERILHRTAPRGLPSLSLSHISCESCSQFESLPLPSLTRGNAPLRCRYDKVPLWRRPSIFYLLVLLACISALAIFSCYVSGCCAAMVTDDKARRPLPDGARAPPSGPPSGPPGARAYTPPPPPPPSGAARRRPVPAAERDAPLPMPTPAAEPRLVEID